MNQQINLYLPEFKVERDPLTALVMAQILGVAIAIMVLISTYDVITRWWLNGELAELQQTLTEETRKTSELEGILASRAQNDELSNRLERAEALLESSQQIRDFLSGTKLGNIEGFSEYFKDLSRASMNGLSISEFSFGNGGESVTIRGQTIDSALAPRYVANIEDGNSALRARRFSLSTSRADVEASYFNFSLSTANE